MRPGWRLALADDATRREAADKLNPARRLPPPARHLMGPAMKIVLSVLGSLALVASAMAQEQRGSIEGTVRDSSGAVIVAGRVPEFCRVLEF
jgi:hypothetical protein